MTGAATPVAGDDEHTAYCGLPFVEAGADWPMIKSDWSPPEVTVTENRDSDNGEWTVGTICALDLITHLRDHPSDDPNSRLADVVKAVVDRGKWGRVEMGFFNALGNFIERGDVCVGGGWRAAFASRSDGAGARS